MLHPKVLEYFQLEHAIWPDSGLHFWTCQITGSSFSTRTDRPQDVLPELEKLRARFGVEEKKCG